MKSNSVITAMPAAPALILIVGDASAGREAATSPELSPVTAVSVADGHDVARRVRELGPDLVVVGYDGAHEATGDVVRQLRAQPAGRPPVVVIGRPEAIDGRGPGDSSSDDNQAVDEEYLPDDVSTSELIDRIRSSLARPAPQAAAPRRPPVTEQRLDEEIGRELQRSELAQRPGVLAAVTVAELPRLRERLGPHADRECAATFDELFAVDARVLEQHGPRSDGGFWLLMPETGVAAARERLDKLARSVVDTLLDIDGEQAHMTPVIGYAPFAGAASPPALRDQVDTALYDAAIHLDLVPALFSSALPAPPPKRDRLLTMANRLRLPLQIIFTTAMLLSLPFIVYVLVLYAGFDLTTVTYPLMSAALALTATALWIESFMAMGHIDLPEMPSGPFPPATAVVPAYLPNEAATIVETVTQLLTQDYPGDYQVILAYNSPQRLPIEDVLEDLAANDPRLLLLRVATSTSKAQNVNAALAHVRGEFVGVFDADHYPVQGSFTRAWRWLANGHDVVQGHCVVRNGSASWLARLIAVEWETVYAVSHPGRARLHGFGIFGGSNGYWRREALRQVRMHREMLTEDIDSSMRSLRAGFVIVSDPGLVSSELAPISLRALWHQRIRWSQGWTQNSRRHLVPLLKSRRLSGRQKLGATFLLGWVQVVPWVTIQVIPILAFNAWHENGFGHLDWLVPLFVMLSIFTLTVGIVQTVFAYVLGDQRIRRHRGWFVLYAIHSILWFGEFKNLIARVAHVKEFTGERQWRVTPRGATPPIGPDQAPTTLETH